MLENVSSSWYFGKLPREQAESLLISTATGTFIVRESDDNPSELSLSVLEGNDVKHYSIHQLDDGGFYISAWSRFSTLPELIAHYQHVADGLPVQLSKPFSEQNSASEQPNLHQDLKELPRKNILLTEILQEGVFSGIWKGKLRDGDESMNVIGKISDLGTTSMTDFFEEAVIMNSLHHPNIARIHGICSKEYPILIVTEYFQKGSLSNYLHSMSGKSLKVHDLIAISAQVAHGMAYLEKCKVVHRNLAASNVFITEDNFVKVGDFSRARSLKEEGSFTDPNARVFLRWMAPEVLTDGKFTTKSDVWSFGILLYEIITNGSLPYARMSNGEVTLKIIEGFHLRQPVRCPHWLYMIILDCWKPEPEDRPTFEALQYILSINGTLESNLSGSRFSRIMNMFKN